MKRGSLSAVGTISAAVISAAVLYLLVVGALARAPQLTVDPAPWSSAKQPVTNASIFELPAHADEISVQGTAGERSTVSVWLDDVLEASGYLVPGTSTFAFTHVALPNAGWNAVRIEASTWHGMRRVSSSVRFGIVNPPFAPSKIDFRAQRYADSSDVVLSGSAAPHQAIVVFDSSQVKPSGDAAARRADRRAAPDRRDRSVRANRLAPERHAPPVGRDAGVRRCGLHVRGQGAGDDRSFRAAARRARDTARDAAAFRVPAARHRRRRDRSAQRPDRRPAHAGDARRCDRRRAVRRPADQRAARRHDVPGRRAVVRGRGQRRDAPSLVRPAARARDAAGLDRARADRQPPATVPNNAWSSDLLTVSRGAYLLYQPLPVRIAPNPTAR